MLGIFHRILLVSRNNVLNVLNVMKVYYAGLYIYIFYSVSLEFMEVGSGWVGKTTLAKQLAEDFGIVCVDPNLVISFAIKHAMHGMSKLYISYCIMRL